MFKGPQITGFKLKRRRHSYFIFLKPEIQTTENDNELAPFVYADLALYDDQKAFETSHKSTDPDSSPNGKIEDTSQLKQDDVAAMYAKSTKKRKV